MRQLRELALAYLAAVRLDAQMNAGVLRKIRRVGERLGALCAFVRLRFPHMNLGVQLQVRFRAEDLQKKESKRETKISIDCFSMKEKEIYIY